MTRSLPPANFDAQDPLTSHLKFLMQQNNVHEAQLARETNIPQPTLHKILTGKTVDPRASTLKSLADFFKLTIDELVYGANSKLTPVNNTYSTIPILTWSDCLVAMDITSNYASLHKHESITTEFISDHAYALPVKPSMEPRFTKNTILVVNPELKPADGDLVIVHFPGTDDATLRELALDGPTIMLNSINRMTSAIEFQNEIKLLGVAVKAIMLL